MEVAMKWLTKTANMLMGKPPKLYNPSYLTVDRAMKRFNENVRAEGFSQAYGKLRMETSARKGTFVGTDYNGNRYYEDRAAPYGRSRWVEYPTPAGAATTMQIDLRFDGSMVSPEWHGWLHYMHDKTGPQLAAEFEKPFKQALPINQSMMRPEFSREGLDPPMPPQFHQPPGAHAARVERGRIGPKYEAWSGSPSSANPAQRNFADNSKTLHIP